MKESIRGRKKKVRGHSYTQRLELTLYSDKGLGVILPEKPRQIYSGTSSGDIIGFVTAMPISQMWKMSRIDYVCQVQFTTSLQFSDCIHELNIKTNQQA